MFLAIAAVGSMCVHQLDVESAFIYAPLHDPNAVKDWKRVIVKFHMQYVLVVDSYYTIKY